MKQKDAVIGGRYTVKVSGRTQVVQIIDIHISYSLANGRCWKTYVAVNQATGRQITIDSNRRLRRVEGGLKDVGTLVDL